MDWIFMVLAAGTLALLGAQWLDHEVESTRRCRARPQWPSFVTDVPPADLQPSTEVSFEFDQAA